MARAHLTRRALLDVDAIAGYSAERWGERVARQYLADLFAGMRRLEDSPALLQERPSHSLRLRFYRVREHVLVCDVIGDELYVLAVWHGAMDLPGRLIELEPQLVHEAELLVRQIELQGGS